MNTKGFKRKLTAIMSTDVVGYSRLMGEDEEGTIRTLTEYRKLISGLTAKHRGRVVDSPGDNLLAEFASVVDAVNCAVKIQKGLETKMLACLRTAEWSSALGSILEMSLRKKIGSMVTG